LAQTIKIDPQDLVFDVDAWLDQSHKEASEAYKGVLRNESVPLAYIMKNQQTTQRKIVIAGHRIAAVLQSLFTQAP
jgi:hypothetical protein